MFQSTRPVWGATRRMRSTVRRRTCFNPRAPCGARPMSVSTYSAAAVFQSTRPVWGATQVGIRRCLRIRVSIHAPRVGRDKLVVEDKDAQGVSIHAPRVGRDLKILRRHQSLLRFNPRAPCGARPLSSVLPPTSICFNPRAPCGARQELIDALAKRSAFQSTRPVWGATGAESLVSVDA